MMKKVLCVILSLCMLSCCIPFFSASAEETLTQLTQKADYPIVFVTGIGQTFTRLMNPDGTFKLDKNDNEVRYNLFYADANYMLTQKESLVSVIKLVCQLLLSAAFDKNMMKTQDMNNIVNALFHYNIVDENGKLSHDVENALKEKPVSEFNKFERDMFFRTIPCENLIQDIGEENVYCFNYSAFSYLQDDAAALDDFIENVVKSQTGAEKVILIPMSMGAAVTNAYLQDFSYRNSVRRIVSIVGAWNGSDVFADLLEGKFAKNAPELLYNGLLSSLVGEPWGYLVNIAIRIMPKVVLRSIIDQVLDSFLDQFILKTTSLSALIPAERYPELRENVLLDPKWDSVREQTDHYYEAQSRTAERLKALAEDKENPVDIFFLCGYDLGFGGGKNSYYEFFKFMDSAATTNSDEIIQISSTGVGTTYAPFGTKLTADCYREGTQPGDSKYISPDGSIDVSTCIFPDRIWCFREQIHELEDNNTALRLALDLAIGKYQNTEDCKDIYPQFNDSRKVDKCIDNYIPDLITYLEENEDDKKGCALAQKTLDECQAMINSTFNNREEDDKVIENTYRALVELGVYDAPKESKIKNAFNYILTKALKNLNDRVYDKYGAKGFADYKK